MLITGMILAAVAVIDGAGGSLSAVPGNCAGNAQRRNGNYCGDFARGYLLSSCCAYVR